MNSAHKIVRTVKGLSENFYFGCHHTYIIGHYNPSVSIIDLVYHTTCVVYSVNSIPNDTFFFEKLFMAILFDAQSFGQKSAERKSPKTYFLYFVLLFSLGLELWF